MLFVVQFIQDSKGWPMSNQKIGILGDFVPVEEIWLSRVLLIAQCPSQGVKGDPQKLTFSIQISSKFLFVFSHSSLAIPSLLSLKILPIPSF